MIREPTLDEDLPKARISEVVIHLQLASYMNEFLGHRNLNSGPNHDRPVNVLSLIHGHGGMMYITLYAYRDTLSVFLPLTNLWSYLSLLWSPSSSSFNLTWLPQFLQSTFASLLYTLLSLRFPFSILFFQNLFAFPYLIWSSHNCFCLITFISSFLIYLFIIICILAQIYRIFMLKILRNRLTD